MPDISGAMSCMFHSKARIGLGVALLCLIATQMPSAEAQLDDSKELGIYAMTYTNKYFNWFCKLLFSAYANGIDLEVLGWNEDFIYLGNKLVALHKRLLTLEDSDIVVFMDGTDVIFTDMSLQDIRQQFLQSGHDILFSAEKGCYPLPDRVCKNEYPYGDDLNDSPWRYLNSGTFVGRVWALKQLFHATAYRFCADSAPRPDGKEGAVAAGQAVGLQAFDMASVYQCIIELNDQEIINWMFVRKEQELPGLDIGLDYNCDLFQTMHLSLDVCDITAEGQLVNTDRQSYPGLVHYNGYGKGRMAEVFWQLWYSKLPYQHPRTGKKAALHWRNARNQEVKGTGQVVDDICGFYFGQH